MVLILRGGVLLGGCAGAVQDAGGGADVHVEGDADGGVAGHAGDVGGFEVPAGQGALNAEYARLIGALVRSLDVCGSLNSGRPSDSRT